MRSANCILPSFTSLPVTSLHKLLVMRRALILAPHPDDESLGCGGLIAQSCAAGQPPVVAILTDGAASHPGSCSHPPSRLRGLRQAEARRAVNILGLENKNLIFLNYPDTALPNEGPEFARIVERLTALAIGAGCGVIIGPWLEDPHGDHQAAAQIAAALALALGALHLSYPIWGWLLPPDKISSSILKIGWRLTITHELPLKRRAVSAHESQYGGIIKDTPDGFQLPAALLQACLRPYEVFLET